MGIKEESMFKDLLRGRMYYMYGGTATCIGMEFGI